MEAWHFANGAIAAIGAVLLAWVVLHPDIREGPLLKVGFAIMSVSLALAAYLSFSESRDWLTMWKAGFWLRVGLCLVGLGVMWRLQRRPHNRRRARDIFNIQQ